MMNPQSQDTGTLHPHPATKKPVIKCVVWDLDHTLWNGILSEHDELQLRPGIVELLDQLDKWGVLLSVASKNNYDDAIARLEQFGIRHYFLYPQISWDLKSTAIQTIKEKLNIGFDAIAFIDDQPFEREEVQFVHKDVHCFDVDIIANAAELFKPRFVTAESSLRRQMYIDDDKRNDEEKEIGNNRAFLESLDLAFTIAPATIDDLQRVEELTVRTNQLNATGYSYSYDELETLLHSPDHILLVAELTDKYGSYGKIGVAMLEKTSGTWTLKLLLMSCRVMSRGVGGVLLNYLINRAKKEGVQLLAEFLPTDRNRLMYVTYKFSGFSEAGKLDNGGVLLQHPLADEIAYPDYIKLTIY